MELEFLLTVHNVNVFLNLFYFIIKYIIIYTSKDNPDIIL